jgi:3-mercaptopyruvate sulfurtransferase SseA
MLKKFGHKNAYILNGSLQQWKEEGGKTEAGGEPGPSESGDYEYNIDSSFIVNLDEIIDLVEEGDTSKNLIDARPQPAFEKPPKEGRSLGQIPNAIHADPTKLLKESGSVHKSPEAIKGFLTGLGNNH